MSFITEAIVIIGTSFAIIIALCFIFLAISSFIITKDENEYNESIKELEEEGDSNESDSK